MHFQFDVSNFNQLNQLNEPEAPATAPPVETPLDLLRQILEVQRQQLSLLQASAAAHDVGSRWRAFLARWREDFPDLADYCREVVPVMERTYGSLIADLVDQLRQNNIDNDFALQEFLDRYGMRLAQLGTILNLVAPIAEAGSQGEST
jgi:hypothetical protein